MNVIIVLSICLCILSSGFINVAIVCGKHMCTFIYSIRLSNLAFPIYIANLFKLEIHVPRD